VVGRCGAYVVWTLGALAVMRATPATAADPSGVEIELRANAPAVRIDRLVDGVAVPACVAPCVCVLPRDGTYVIDGPGVRPTKPFMLAPNRYARTTLDVRAGSNLRFGAGVGATAAGALAFLGGSVAMVVVGFHDLATRPDDAPPDPWMRRLLVTSLVGIPVILTGVVLVLTSPTRVTTSNDVSFSLHSPQRIRARRLVLTPRGLEF
jgi:hypothetical protein